MNKTRIDWCDYTWNPITGCLHGCEYCYARKTAYRFGIPITDIQSRNHEPELHVLKNKIKRNPYPYLFEPTLHEYRLLEPAQNTKPETIFVGSMADVFGEWVPDEWIQAVFAACEAAPQHRYLFLTKNPGRYVTLLLTGKLPKKDNYWYGTTKTKRKDQYFSTEIPLNTFISIEPMLERFKFAEHSIFETKWVIVGAETGNRASRVTPDRLWIEEIIETARAFKKPIFMKHNLVLAGVFREEELIQELPWQNND